MQLLGLTIRWTEELHCLLPRTEQRPALDARAQPAPAVQEVVTLLHQHLAQTVPQHLDGTAGARLDRRRERRVEDRVGGDEPAPLGPGFIEVSEVADRAGIGFAFRAARVAAQWFETAIEDAAVAKVVETHRRGGDVGF